MGAKKVVRSLSEQHGHGPFDQLIARTDRQDDADRQEGEHTLAAHIGTSNQNLPRHERGNEALKEMTDFVVGVATKIQEIGDLKP